MTPTLDIEIELPLLQLMPYEQISGRSYTFVLLTRERPGTVKQEGIHCLQCRLTSWHPEDVRSQFCSGCGACHLTLAMAARLRGVYRCQRCQSPELRLPLEGVLWPAPEQNAVIRFPSGSTLSGTGAFYCPGCSPSVVFCADCGCTDEAGCEEGCFWATPDTCSACLGLEVAHGSAVMQEVRHA